MKGKKFLKERVVTFLCVFALLSGILVAAFPEDVSAKFNTRTKEYLSRCANSITTLDKVNPKIKVLGSVVLVECTIYTGHYPVYAVEPGTKIQGKKIDSKYFPQDNLEYLMDVKANYRNNFLSIVNLGEQPAGTQFICHKGTVFKNVVAYDKDWVIFWDDGFQKWTVKNSMISIFGCTQEMEDYSQSHVAGFYKLPRKSVWIDPVANHPYKKTRDVPKAGTATIKSAPKTGAPVMATPDETGGKTGVACRLRNGNRVDLVSTKKYSSRVKGSKRKFYKVSCHYTYKSAWGSYMNNRVPGVYYIETKYLKIKSKKK